MKRFLGAEDYYWILLEQFSHGDFYVESETGKRLYIVSPSGRGLKQLPADIQIYSDLLHVPEGSETADLSEVPKTADAIRSLHPKGCR